ncbi:helix-turn-helix domain-containing protein [Synechocystis sp. PCC 7509]|uniref:helix-turn-helix domain-containing protein n=1 Tax=Synechocystis sp. PCC 7509 TaxID=927677 RepID=UPI00192CA893|nr:helix-turn-helix transcriptional regulator [Synechocystis sp. PCC 7509]
MYILDIEMLADLLRTKRGKSGLREISPAAGVSPSTISRIENGAIPDMATFLAICDWLKIPPHEFIRNTEHKEIPHDYFITCSKLRTDKRIDSNIGNAIANLIEAVFNN